MTLKYWLASALALAALSCACSSDRPRPTPPAPRPAETALRSLLPGSSAPGADAEGDCVPAECPEIVLFGSLAPGCCRGTQACGGLVQIAERSWLCLSPDDDRTAEALRGALTAHAGEPLVAEPSCPSQTLDGSTLAGCCITGGTCGVSTEPWTAAAAELDLQLPSACILASEAAQVTGTALADAGPPPACDSPSLAP